jgi:dienelactone hydrolase
MRVTVLCCVVMGSIVAMGQEGLPHDRPILVREGAEVRAARTAEEWEGRRGAILEGMQEVMGKLPGEERRVPLAWRVTETVELDGFIRKRIEIDVEKGDVLPAYLLIPKGLTGKAPAVLCLHQTTRIGKGSPAGLGDRAALFQALDLARGGYVTLAPDYPYFGEYKADPYALGYASATMKGIWNHMRCVDVLQSLPEVDGERIGCVGHSLGGHNTLFVAAFDRRIKACVSNCGFTSFAKYYGGDLTGWSSEKYMPRIAGEYGKDPKRMPFDFPELLAAIAPRGVMVIGNTKDANFDVGGVRDCVAGAGPVFGLLGAKGKLVAVYPEAGHEFTEEGRRAAYEFLGRELKR